MNPTDPSSQPLELQPWLWVALGIVTFIGLSEQMRDQGEGSSFEPTFDENLVIVRSSAPDHAFPILNLQISLPEGWSYLSVTDDAIADKPTFVNESADSIVRFQPFRAESWLNGEADVDRREYANVTIEWISQPSQWKGRLVQAEANVILLVHKQSPKSEFSEAVEELCDSIELMDAAD